MKGKNESASKALEVKLAEAEIAKALQVKATAEARAKLEGVIKENEALQAKLAAKKASVETEEDNDMLPVGSNNYTSDEFKQILMLKLPGRKVCVEESIVSKDKQLLNQRTEELVNKVVTTGQTSVIPLPSSNNYCCGLVVKKAVEGGLQVIHVNFRGNKLTQEKNAQELVTAIMQFSNETRILELSQQLSNTDRAPLLIEYLVILATNPTNLSREYVQNLLADAGDVASIKLCQAYLLQANYGTTLPIIQDQKGDEKTDSDWQQDHSKDNVTTIHLDEGHNLNIIGSDAG